MAALAIRARALGHESCGHESCEGETRRDWPELKGDALRFGSRVRQKPESPR
jgi:hypothetical protein